LEFVLSFPPSFFTASLASSWATLVQTAGKKRVPKHLVLAGEVELTPRQRAQVAETLDYPCKVAVMVSSPITRGMLTAIGWLTGKHRAFSMTDLAGALHISTSLQIGSTRSTATSWSCNAHSVRKCEIRGPRCAPGRYPHTTRKSVLQEHSAD
jgi:hypothetical protein